MLTDFSSLEYDRADPDPWLALYLDQSIPIDDAAKRAILTTQQSRSRQFLLPIVRPFARLAIVIIQLFKTVIPDRFTSSRLLHRILVWTLNTWVSPEANTLILRHFHLGSQILAFIAANVCGADVPLSPLEPVTLDELRDDVFLRHDVNLYNFIIELNKQLRQRGLRIEHQPIPDLSAIAEPPPFEMFPRRWTNFIDLQTALEIFTPLYQLLLKDGEFWRASMSLQLDECVAVYATSILGDRSLLALVNNRHPLVPMSTLRAGFRLMLHGLATESLHAILLQQKNAQRQSSLQSAAVGAYA
jgi:hypothetical protein